MKVVVLLFCYLTAYCLLIDDDGDYVDTSLRKAATGKPKRKDGPVIAAEPDIAVVLQPISSAGMAKDIQAGSGGGIQPALLSPAGIPLSAGSAYLTVASASSTQASSAFRIIANVLGDIAQSPLTTVSRVPVPPVVASLLNIFPDVRDKAVHSTEGDSVIALSVHCLHSEL